MKNDWQVILNCLQTFHTTAIVAVMEKWTLASLTILVACSNVSAPTKAGECLNLVSNPEIEVSGKLTSQLFAGPPNFESIAKGDAEEHALILELSSRMCANDGEFIEPSESFDRVQVGAFDDSIRDILNSAVGRSVTVRGEAFGSQTGHHHAPLVLMVEEISVK